MPTHVSGIIDAPAATRTHTEPPENITGATATPNQGKGITVGEYTNTGNVSQTVTVEVTNPVGCTIVGVNFQNSQLQNLGNSVTLTPTQGRFLKVDIQTSAVPPGDDVPYSFDVVSTWT